MDYELKEQLAELYELINNLMDDLDDLKDNINTRKNLINEYNEVITDMSNIVFNEKNEIVRKHLLDTIIVYNDEINRLNEVIKKDQNSYDYGKKLLKEKNDERKVLKEKLKEYSEQTYSISKDKDGSLLVRGDNS